MLKQFLIKNLLTIHSSGVGSKIWIPVQLAVLLFARISLAEKVYGRYVDSRFFTEQLI